MRPGTHLAEGVLALTPESLSVTELPVTGADVVGADRAGHRIEGVVYRDAVRRVTDDDGQLRLGVDVADAGWQDDGVSVAAESARGLAEQDGLEGQGLTASTA